MNSIAAPRVVDNAEAAIHISDYRRNIDGLRAVAVMAVLVFHTFPGYLPGGFVGVDIFFVISGFLITKVILSDSIQGGSAGRSHAVGRKCSSDGVHEIRRSVALSGNHPECDEVRP